MNLISLNVGAKPIILVEGVGQFDIGGGDAGPRIWMVGGISGGLGVGKFCVSTIMLHPSKYQLAILVDGVSMLQPVVIQWH